jgi:hypothetical protein
MKNRYGDFEKELKNNMVPADAKSFAFIEVALLERLNKVSKTVILKSDENGFFMINGNTNFGFDFCGTDVIVFYHNEHKHFMGMDYETTEEWVSSISDFISQINNHTVRFENHYQGKTLIRTKIFSVENGNDVLIENFGTSFNLFKIFSKKQPRIESELIEFKKADA